MDSVNLNLSTFKTKFTAIKYGRIQSSGLGTGSKVPLIAARTIDGVMLGDKEAVKLARNSGSMSKV